MLDWYAFRERACLGLKRITKLQDKAIRIINFAHYRESTSKLYKNSKILKFKDNITLNNYLYIYMTA